MPKKRPSDATSPPNLVVPKAEAEQKIKTQIEKGRGLKTQVINSDEDLQRAKAELSKWSAYNVDLLTRLFDNESIAKEYNRGVAGIVPHGAKFAWFVNNFRQRMHRHITRLESVLGRLELFTEHLAESTSSIASDQTLSTGNEVFVVHGRDTAAKEAVSRFIEKLDLHPIILHEQPNEGRTIIEKFEDYSHVGFAIVILSPDDIGGSRNEPDQQNPRARQNVIFELGYFVGKIGRRKVCALFKEDVDMPSDYHGVLYVPMDPNDAWQLKVAREIKQAGLKVDLNKVL